MHAMASLTLLRHSPLPPPPLFLPPSPDCVQSLKSVSAAIGSHPGHIPVTLEFQKCVI